MSIRGFKPSTPTGSTASASTPLVTPLREAPHPSVAVPAQGPTAATVAVELPSRHVHGLPAGFHFETDCQAVDALTGSYIARPESWGSFLGY